MSFTCGSVNMKEVALYVRVSTKEQSPAMQLSDLRRYIARENQEGLFIKLNIIWAFVAA